MGDLIATPIVILLGALLIARRARALPDHAQTPLALAFVARVASAFALVWLTKYFFGGGDMLWYYEHGVFLASLISEQPEQYAVPGLMYALGRPVDDPIFYFSGRSTGTMFGLSSWMMLLLGGDALYGACVLLAILNLWSGTYLCEVFLRELPRRYHEAVVWLALLLPSMVFWTSGLLKESPAMIGLGLVFAGISDLIRRQGWRWMLLLPLGLWCIGAFKAYVLFPLLACAALWWYAARSLRQTGELAIVRKPMSLLAAVAVGVAGVWGLGMVFPRYALGNLLEEAVFLQRVGARVGGGSTFAGGPAGDASLAGQLVRLPLGMLTALFRPLPFDIHNAAVLLNAVEMVAIVGLWIRMLVVRPLFRTLRLLTLNPFLLSVVVFVLFFAAAVGLTTTNMGTLSRYRVPMMPLYLMLLWVLGSRLPNE